MYQEGDEDIQESIYEKGHWEWDTKIEALKFVSDIQYVDEDEAVSNNFIRNIKFRDDIDLLEQHQFKKLFQRKTNEDDVVILQDVKDIVLYTAPASILSPAVINMLHLPTTERFLRALILCCQYYIQTSDEMNHRTLELETKIQTKHSEEIERKYQEDIEDLRLLVAKEYYVIILGGDEFAKYHHMGTTKMKSLSKKDAILFETILCIAIQIIWIALGRKSYTKIESEVNRIFKSDIYNAADHRLNTNLVQKMNSRERLVLLGNCVKRDKKLNSRSPLINEIFCHRNIDYRLFGLGTIKYSRLSSRLSYLESLLSRPESSFSTMGLTLGILGLNRARFDIMLNEIKFVASTSVSSASMRSARMSKTSRKSAVSAVTRKIYPDLYLPEKESTPASLPDLCPFETIPSLSAPCMEKQRRKWLRRSLVRRKKRANVIKNKK